MTAALILAAGVGSRLRPLTNDRPKALVEVAGKPLLEWLVSACRQAGLGPIVVVTGYRHEDIDAWCQRNGSDLSTVYNTDYDTINNAHSLWVAKDALQGQAFIKLDGDILLPDGELLEALLNHPEPTAALVDTQRQLDAEAMKAQVADGMITAFGKWLELDSSHGESIGIEKIAASDARQLFDAIAQAVQVEGLVDLYYEDVYHRLLQQPATQFRMAACPLGAQRWTEIDDHDDLAEARRLLQP